MTTVIDRGRKHRATCVKQNQDEKGRMTYFPKALQTKLVLLWHLPYKSTQMDYLGPPPREGSGQETKILYADLDAPLAALSTLPPLGQGEGRSRLAPCAPPGPTDAGLHPVPCRYLDWGRCRSPFHRLMLAVGSTVPKAFQGCAT